MISELALEQMRSGRYAGPLEGHTHYGVAGSPGDGPHVQIWLRVEDGRIEEARYQTHGCPSSMAASAMLCRLVTNMPVENAREITDQDLLTVLGGLPEGKGHFAGMAVTALHQAILCGEQGSLS